MRNRTRTKTNRTVAVTQPLWDVIEVRVLPRHRLHVRFEDDTEGEVDVAPLILGPRPGVFKVLRDPAEFAKAYIDHGAVTWPGELDLAPDAMYDEIKANGRWVVPA
jgi:hypothetical protein